jgi:prepilin-type N-terminal cleavage/methylation domain-containing protein
MKQETLNIKLEALRFLKRLKCKVYPLGLSGGFTLVEFLIVISVISLSVGSVLVFLTSTLKGANQANIISEVRQNGQAVLDNLQTQIRASKKAEYFSDRGVTLPAGWLSGLFLTLSTGEQLNVVCFKTAGSNGWIGVYKDVAGTLPNITSTYQPLTNNSSVSGVDISCSATTFQINTNKNLVIIGFTANQGVGAPSRADFLANARFVTTVGIRSY